MKKRVNSRKRRTAALKSAHNRDGESFADAVARYRYQHREWLMLAVLDTIRDAEQVKGKLPTSVHEAEIISARAHAADHIGQLDRLWNRLRAKNNGQPPTREDWLPARDKLLAQLATLEKQSAWRRLLKDFERAVLNRDASWFEAQARAIKGIGFHQIHGANRQRFEVAVMCELRHAPEGVTAQDILERLEQHAAGKHLIVEGCRFSSARRCRAEIKRLAARKGKKLD
jgi:hypothetical protein